MDPVFVSNESVAHVTAFADWIDVFIPDNYTRMYPHEVEELIDVLCEALRAIAKSK